MSPTTETHAGVLATAVESAEIFHELRHFAVTGSTMAVASQAITTGTPPGLVVLADEQDAGRGRNGRSWVDAGPGSAVALTATIAKPSVPTLAPIRAGLATAQALENLGVQAALKWPNDLMVDHNKIGGILCQLVSSSTGDQVSIGIGVNVDFRSVDGAELAWTSLAELRPFTATHLEVAAAIVTALDEEFSDDSGSAQDVVERFERRLLWMGERVRVNTMSSEPVDAMLLGIDETGAARLRNDRGEHLTIAAGDVEHLRAAPAPLSGGHL